MPHDLINRLRYLEAMSTGAGKPFPVVVDMIQLKKDFNNIIDNSYASPNVKETLTSKFMTISYTRPVKELCYGSKDKGKEGEMRSGDDVIMALHNWLLKKIRLRGQNNNLGFLFFYELLIGSFPVRILPGDHSSILAHFLIRMMPHE
jgi:hypothetical protein